MYFLKDIATISAGDSAPDKSLFTETGRPFVRAGSLEFLVRGEPIEQCEKVDELLAKEKKLRLFPKGSIVFAKSGMSAKMGRIYILPEDAYVVNHLAIITTVDSSVNASFICYYFSHRPPVYLIKDDAYPSISLKDIGDMQIEIPDLDIQNKIVAILDKANSLVKKREETIAKYDELLRATFLEMFLKFQGINTQKLDEVAHVVSGLTKGKNYKGKTTDMYPYMRVANVQDGYLDLNEIKEIEATAEEAKRYKLEEDDLLLTEGGDSDKLGRGTLWKNQVENCIYQNHIFRVRVKDRQVVNPTFLSFQLSSQYGKAYFLKAAKQTSGIASINSTQLKAFPVYLPPIEEQTRFEKIIQKGEANKAALSQSLQIINDLNGAIAQLAFKGELTFNTAVDLEVLLENDYDFFKANSTVQSIQLLLERLDKNELNDKKIYEEASYNKAKSFVFGLLQEGVIEQAFDERTKTVKLVLA